MRATSCFLLTAVLLGVFVGCQTTAPDVHSVPVARDYGELEAADIKDAAKALNDAHSAGAQHFASFEYASAERYLIIAKSLARRHDRKGAWDYAALAQQMAEAALREVPEMEIAAPAPMAKDEETCQAEYERVKALYLELDAEKAAAVSPILFAHVTAALSKAEHDLKRNRGWDHAAKALVLAESDINIIRIQDVDEDGVADMKDDAPWLPEDKDGFEDEDGAPDLDNDQDGVLDPDDLKPLDAETRNQWHDFDGAPDEHPELEPIPFASGSATLSSDSKGYIRGLAQLLAFWPQLQIHVKGYTDNSHSTKYNLDLSRRRAQKVQQYLMQNGLGEEQIIVTFHGEADPASEGSSAAARALNRRVQIVLE
jgi:outer membrane protein OmpA-like peptidoglycan-associated protein